MDRGSGGRVTHVVIMQPSATKVITPPAIAPLGFKQPRLVGSVVLGVGLVLILAAGLDHQ